MRFADQLIEQAYHLARRERTRPRQASLRRALSTAYYALFHLLIAEATKNWKYAGQRHALERVFEHGRMRSASARQRSDLKALFKTGHSADPDRGTQFHLHLVANTFVQSQEQRHIADYDNSRRWTRTEVLEQLDSVAEAFQSWKTISDHDLAQAYLVSLFGKDR